MSTRSVIARPTESGFTGVYHHWDGYPSGLGWTLFELAQPDGPFGGDVELMLKTLIDDHPAGWSTINGADWSKPPGFVEYSVDQLGPCQVAIGKRRCLKPNSQHLCQTHGVDWHMKKQKTYPCADGSYGMHLGHAYLAPTLEPEPRGPECYCHGERAETGNVITEENAAGCGCEWAYLIKADDRLMLISSSYTDIGSEDGTKSEKMVGFFGMGDENAEWRVVTVVSLDDPMSPEMFAKMNGW